MTFSDGEVMPAAQPRQPASAVGIAEITHDLIRDQFSEYLHDSLPERERARVENHLAACQPCRAYWETFRATVKAVGKVPRATAPKSARERLRRIPDA